MAWYEILAIVIVCLLIVSAPILYYFFGWEDRCGRTRWELLFKKKKNTEE